MAISRAQLAKELEPGLNALFGMEYGRYEGQHAEIFDTESSDRAFETVAMAFSITEEAVEDNLYDRLASRYTRALARSMAHTKQVKAASILNNAFTAGASAGGDGVALCDASHPLTNGGFKHFERMALSTSMDPDFDTGNMRYKARERYSFGFSDPRCVFGSPGA